MSQTIRPASVVIILGLLIGLTPFAVDMYLPAIPVIAKSVGASVEQIQLSISVFLFAFGVGQLFYGPLTDSFGRRKVIIVGLCCYSVGSAAIVFSDSYYTLSIWRVLQAFGGGAISVATMATMRDLYTGNKLAKMTSYLVMIMSIAPMIAPSIGAQLLVFFDWHSIFIALTLLGLAGLVLYSANLKESLAVENRHSFNMKQVLLGYGAVLKNRLSVAYLLVIIFSSGPMFIFVTASPFVYMEYLGATPEEFGLLFGLNIIVMTTCAWLNTYFLRTHSFQKILEISIYIGTATVVVLLAVSLSVPADKLLYVIPPLVAVTVGITPLVSSNATAGLMNSHAANAGSAASLSGSLRFGIGGLMGVALSFYASENHLPMAVAMLISGVISLIAFYWLRYLIQKEAIV